MSKKVLCWFGIVGLAVSTTVAGCRSAGVVSSAPPSSTATVVGVDEIEPVMVKSHVDTAYDAVLDHARKLIEAKKFDQIEKQAAQYRKSQEQFLTGYWKLSAFNVGLGEVEESATDAQWEQRRRILAGWTRRDPRSITAHVALARCYYDGAYRARGNGFADTVKEDQWEVMYEHLDKAAEVLAASTKMRSRCPGWFAAAQRVAALEGRSQKEFNAITDEALRLFPKYDDFHFFRARELMPRWGGEKGDWQKYAIKVSYAAGNEAGDVLYARIVWDMEAYLSPEIPDELDGFDWPRAKRGFEILRKKPDSLAVVSPYARAAWLAGDHKTAKSLFENPIGNRMDIYAWMDKDEFRKVRRWALED